MLSAQKQLVLIKKVTTAHTIYDFFENWTHGKYLKFKSLLTQKRGEGEDGELTIDNGDSFIADVFK